MKTIFRTQKLTGYFIHSNATARDKNLSLKARGLLAMILTNDECWEVTTAWLESQCGEGRDSIRAALVELETQGYAAKEMTRSESGSFDRLMWTFHGERQPKSRVPSTDGFPGAGKPGAGLPGPGKPATKKDNPVEGQSERERISTPKFAKPAVEDVEIHCESIGLPRTEGSKFWYYHESRGWVIGRSPMKSWKAALVTWKANWEKFKTSTASPVYKPKKIAI
jgi:hypothetical protein